MEIVALWLLTAAMCTWYIYTISNVTGTNLEMSFFIILTFVWCVVGLPIALLVCLVALVLNLVSKQK